MMNQTKTAVILSIIALVGIGVLIYANKDNLFKDTRKKVAEGSDDEA